MQKRYIYNLINEIESRYFLSTEDMRIVKKDLKEGCLFDFGLVMEAGVCYVSLDSFYCMFEAKKFLNAKNEHIYKYLVNQNQTPPKITEDMVVDWVIQDWNLNKSNTMPRIDEKKFLQWKPNQLLKRLEELLNLHYKGPEEAFDILQKLKDTKKPKLKPCQRYGDDD